MVINKALGMTDTFSGISRAFEIIQDLVSVINVEDMNMRVTGMKPVYTRLCVKI